MYCHGRVVKYADDFALGNFYSKRCDQEGLDSDLSRLGTSKDMDLS